LSQPTGQRFQNAHPHAPHDFLGVLRWKLGLAGKKPAPPDYLEAPYSPGFTKPAETAERIRLMWIGHSTFLITFRGRSILTDPIFGHCQPFPFGRMRRLQPPGISFDELPPIDEVLISHSHYDHLDKPAIQALGNKVRYWIPKGLAPWFRRRGIDNCRELGWWKSESFGEGMEIHSVPAQHGSGRTPFDRNRTHWCGWVLRSPGRSLYFAGDTGYSPSFAEIGYKFGGFDLSMIPIGAYEPRWLMQPVHLNPADAVQAHIDVRSRLSVACHWGTFHLTDEFPDEPPALLADELRAREIDPSRFAVLRVGECIEV